MRAAKRKTARANAREFGYSGISRTATVASRTRLIAVPSKAALTVLAFPGPRASVLTPIEEGAVIFLPRITAVRTVRLECVGASALIAHVAAGA